MGGHGVPQSAPSPSCAEAPTHQPMPPILARALIGLPTILPTAKPLTHDPRPHERPMPTPVTFPSKPTSAMPVTRLTPALVTPGSCFRQASTFEVQPLQDIPPTWCARACTSESMCMRVYKSCLIAHIPDPCHHQRALSKQPALPTLHHCTAQCLGVQLYVHINSSWLPPMLPPWYHSPLTLKPSPTKPPP